MHPKHYFLSIHNNNFDDVYDYVYPFIAYTNLIYTPLSFGFSELVFIDTFEQVHTFYSREKIVF